MKRPTRDDVAKLAGVSGCTVSHVLNGRKDISISDATRQRVIKAANELGYRPNHAARSLVTGTTHTIAVWSADLSPYYTMVVNGLRKIIEISGYQILITGINREKAMRNSAFGSIDGILAIEYPDYLLEFFQKNPKFQMPFVNLGVYHLDNIDYVGVDLYTCTYQAVTHLLSNGIGRICYLGVNNPNLYDPRMDAYADAMKDAGLHPEYLLLQGQTRPESRTAIKGYIAEKGCPEGLICHNDDQAIGAYRGLCDIGVKVPDDISIVGCDGIEDTEYLECPLSTIVQPIDKMCEIAWDFLKKRIEDPSIPFQQIMLQSKLEIRDSSKKSRAAKN